MFCHLNVGVWLRTARKLLFSFRINCTWMFFIMFSGCHMNVFLLFFCEVVSKLILFCNPVVILTGKISALHSWHTVLWDIAVFVVLVFLIKCLIEYIILFLFIIFSFNCLGIMFHIPFWHHSFISFNESCCC